MKLLVSGLIRPIITLLCTLAFVTLAEGLIDKGSNTSIGGSFLWIFMYPVWVATVAFSAVAVSLFYDRPASFFPWKRMWRTWLVALPMIYIVAVPGILTLSSSSLHGPLLWIIVAGKWVAAAGIHGIIATAIGETAMYGTRARRAFAEWLTFIREKPLQYFGGNLIILGIVGLENHRDIAPVVGPYLFLQEYGVLCALLVIVLNVKRWKHQAKSKEWRELN